MKKIIFIFLIFFSITGLHGEFAPWNTDIKSGDALYHSDHAHKNYSNVYNGVQGGAFFLIKFYQIVISPQDGPNCRHIPTCSAYGKQAVIRHGAFIGSILAGDRILRCNPFYPPEKDPVPDKVFEK